MSSAVSDNLHIAVAIGGCTIRLAPGKMDLLRWTIIMQTIKGRIQVHSSCTTSGSSIAAD